MLVVGKTGACSMSVKNHFGVPVYSFLERISLFWKPTVLIPRYTIHNTIDIIFPFISWVRVKGSRDHKLDAREIADTKRTNFALGRS